jgi:hypothetical protein
VVLAPVETRRITARAAQQQEGEHGRQEADTAGVSEP